MEAVTINYNDYARLIRAEAEKQADDMIANCIRDDEDNDVVIDVDMLIDDITGDVWDRMYSCVPA